MQKYLDILLGLDRQTLILAASVCLFLFVVFGFFLSKDRKQTSFWEKILGVFVLFAGLAAFIGFAYGGLYFGQVTGIGGYGIVISLGLFWFIGHFIQKMRARKRNRLINEQFQRSVVK